MTVENALYHDERLSEVAAVGIPDQKLGEIVAAVAVTKPEYHGKVTEAELIQLAKSKCVPVLICCRLFSHRFSRLPYFAVPVMVIVRSEPFGEMCC